MSPWVEDPLFPPPPPDREPPRTCPHCGLEVRRVSFVRAECVSCGFVWTRTGQLAADEEIPY